MAGGCDRRDAERTDGGLPPADVPWSESEDSVAWGLSGRSDGFGLGSDFPLELDPGTDVGGFTIRRLLGEGGMGRVYEARQTSPDRLVAVKVLRDALATPERLYRFQHEAAVLGRLRHPHIAQIYLAGVHRHGAVAVPFVVMELVGDARTITQHARDGGLGLRGRIELARRVCDAVAHAHRKGVIHRDLKPANILVDGAGEPKVIDFGVARSLAVDSAAAPYRTVAGQIVGTLLYMSPEQFSGQIDEIDARADVYSLGVVLHELSADRPPYDPAETSLLAASRAREDAGLQAARIVERAATQAGADRFSARSLAAIVHTCLQPRPDDRYATAVELTAELDRWLVGEPVLARPPTWLEWAGRTIRRHRAATAAAAVGLATIVAAAVGITVFALRAAEQARVARAELYTATVQLAADARDRDRVGEARQLLAEAQRLAGPGEPLELACLAASLDDSFATLAGHTADVLAAAWSPDGTRLATGDRAGAVRVVDASARDAMPEAVGEFGGHNEAVWRIAWSPDGRMLATASADGTARLWDAATGRELQRIPVHGAGERLYGVAFGPDGTVVATAGSDRTARLWDVATGGERVVLTGHTGTVFSVVLSRDGGRALTASLDGTARLWDAESGALVRTFSGHDDWVFDADFAPDETAIATASRDGTARVWTIATGSAEATFLHPERVNAVEFTGDGRRVATACHDGVLRIFRPGKRDPVRQFRGHEGPIWTVASGPTDARMATGAGDRTVRLWETAGRFDPVIPAPAGARAAAWSRDGTVVAVASGESVIGIYDGRTFAPRRRIGLDVQAVHDVAFDPRTGALFAACSDGIVARTEIGSRGETTSHRIHKHAVYSVDVSPDGARLATASDDGTFTIRDSATLESVLKGENRHSRRVWCARFAPDGERLYTAGDDRRAVAWDVVTGGERLVFAGHEAAVKWVAVAADGRQLATASADGTVGIWNAENGQLVHRLRGPGCEVTRVAFSPDGTRVVAVASDGSAHLWDVASGRPFPVLRGAGSRSRGLAFSPDGGAVVIGAGDATLRCEGVSVAEVFRRLAISPQPR